MSRSSPRRSTNRSHTRRAGFRYLHAERLEPRALLAGVEVNYPLIDYNGIAYFPGRTDDGDFHLWRSDGTAAGTRMVSPAPMYVQNNEPTFLAAVNGTLFFSSPDEFQIGRLWKSDGTAAGTTRVTLPGNPAGYLNGLTAVGNTLFFDAFDGANRNLWRSDGTDAGTVLVKDVYVGGGDPHMTNVNNTTLFFVGNDPAGGDELWKSDGTEAGTVRVKDIVPGPDGSGISQVTNVDGKVFFITQVGSSGQELWVSDGTEGGTVMLQHFAGSGFYPIADWLTGIGDKLYFTAEDGIHGYEPWISDGTPTGTQLLKDINSGPNGSYAKGFVDQNGSILFIARSGGPPELWKTDGTSAGTKFLTAPLAAENTVIGSIPMTSANGITYFATHTSPGGNRLWKTDGTGIGTVSVKGLGLPYDFQFPGQLIDSGSRLFFEATGNPGHAVPVLWTSDGTSNGTYMIDLSGNHSPVALDDQVIMSEDQSVIADPPGVLINDTDADKDSLIAILDAQAMHGRVQLGLAGNFTYTPKGNYNGTDQFTYHVSDGQADSGLATVTIHIAAVNDSPTFTAGANQSVRDDAGDQLILNWAHDVSPGPDEESFQGLTFHVLADHPEMFAVAPRIEADGKLAFTPAPNAEGDATITVTLQDDGGTDSGGNDTSPPQTFVISIHKLHPWRNTLDHLDVNGDTAVAADDVLAIINYLNAVGSGKLPEGPATANHYYDTDGDDECTANDVIEVINSINARPNESEAATVQPGNNSSSSATVSDLMSLLAADIATTQLKRRR